MLDKSMDDTTTTWWLDGLNNGVFWAFGMFFFVFIDLQVLQVYDCHVTMTWTSWHTTRQRDELMDWLQVDRQVMGLNKRPKHIKQCVLGRWHVLFAFLNMITNYFFRYYNCHVVTMTWMSWRVSYESHLWESFFMVDFLHLLVMPVVELLASPVMARDAFTHALSFFGLVHFPLTTGVTGLPHPGKFFISFQDCY